MNKIPPYLKAGDKIALVCPAGFMMRDQTNTCVSRLQSWGYQVRIGDTIGGSSQTYFSGTDEERREDFQQMLDDDSIRAILCARGGYGTGRIIGQLDFKKFKQAPKWIIGFSDITVLHCHLLSELSICSLHAPMAAAFNEVPDNDPYILSLKNALAGVKQKYQCDVHTFNRKGEAVAELVGGNLSLIAHLAGTPDQLKTKGKILFLEDVGEYIYGVDRMFYQLKRSGALAKLAGLVIGGFTDMKDTERPFGRTVYDLIRELVSEYEYPVCFNFPVSHDQENYALKVGVGYRLKVGKTKVILEE